ncbi:MAG: DUF3800 domain-containing protein [Microbacteriaceae bacterium]|nr:DUF3800 domain-containing protein [Microbacteriaceae bacterium]
MPSSDSDVSGRSLFVFIDESGNFDFSERGTRHFVLSAHITLTPLECGHRLNALTYEFLAKGLIDQIPFHASENSLGTRRRVVENMCPAKHSCRVATFYARKNRLDRDFCNSEELLAQFGLRLAERLGAERNLDKENLVLLFDTALTAKRKQAMLRRLKSALRSRHISPRVLFRPVKHDVNGQIADFYAWAVFRRLESLDQTWERALPGPHTIEELK